MPIDLIGLTGLLVVAFLYFYYSTPFNHRDLLFILALVFLLLIITTAILFLKAFFLHFKTDKPRYFKNCLISSLKEIKVFSRQIIPFFIYISLYNQIHDLARKINNCDLDYILIKIDRFLLAGYDVTVLAEKVISNWLTNWLTFVYSGFFLFFLVTPLFLFLTKKQRALEDLLLAVVIASYLGLVGYILVPCVGPILAQQNLLTVPLWSGDSSLKQVYQSVVADYAGYKDFFHCFPSLHVAVTLIFLVFAKRQNKILFFIYLPIILSIWLSTIYLRWHYLVDDLIGILIGLLAIVVAPQINQWWRKKLQKH